MSSPAAAYRTSAGPWIAGGIAAVVVVVAALIWWQAQARPAHPVASMPIPAAAPTPRSPTPPAVASLTEFASATRARLDGSASDQLPAMDRSHGYTAEGLRRLAAALDTFRDVAARRTADALRTNAGLLEADPRSLRHANILANSFALVTTFLAHRDAEAGVEVRRLAEEIDPNVALLKQRAAVERAFVAAADAVRNLARGA